MARSEIVVPGEPERLSDQFAKAHVWTPDTEGLMWVYSWALDGPMAFMRHARHPDRLSGWKGALWTTPHSQDRPPLEGVRRCNWLIPADGSDRVDEDCQEARTFLADDTIRSVTLTQVVGVSPQTRIEVVHKRLPVVWAEDMAAWWGYQLAILADMLARPSKR